jgi:fructose/tagatose bisphosphate aldolase
MKINNDHLQKLAVDLALAPPAEKSEKEANLREITRSAGVYPASIHDFYAATLRQNYPPMAVPAINIRGMTFDIACAAWRAAQKCQAGPIIFELAPFEMVSGSQDFAEYCAIVQAPAVHEGYAGPVFLQGDLFQVNTREDLPYIKEMIISAIQAGMYNLDMNASPLINQDGISPLEQQKLNGRLIAECAAFALDNSPAGIHLSIGGEVGGLGRNNTTIQDLQAFMNIFSESFSNHANGLDKLSARTGTVLGGIVGTDGSISDMPLDLELVEQLAQKLRQDYSIAGLVQHGASTLSVPNLARLAASGVIEVHLGTQIQNIVFDHPAFPAELIEYMRASLLTSKANPAETLKTAPSQSREQRFYHSRLNAWGMFKEDLWVLPDGLREEISSALQMWFKTLFSVLNVAGKREYLLNDDSTRG